MEHTKPSQTIVTNDANNNSKSNQLSKTTIDSKELVITSITHFEDLSNEVFYEIFEFLNNRHVYKAFWNLNQRFQNLFTNSTLAINADISYMSRSNFQNYYTDIIAPNTHRVISLHLSNPLIVYELFKQDCVVSKMIRLENLILNNIHYSILEDLLTYLIGLPSLSSLDISCIDTQLNRNILYCEIFRLPVLKYCKISSDEHFQSPALPMATNEYSPIEHLNIRSKLTMCDLNALLSYVPQLHRLSLGRLCLHEHEQIVPCSINLNHLTHATLCMEFVTFDQFKKFFKNLFCHLEVLYITIRSYIKYADANQWEQFILSSMPHLRFFDHECALGQPPGDYKPDDIPEINMFQSSFWSQRHWLFTFGIESRRYDFVRVIRSSYPYRRKFYTFYGNLMKSDFSGGQKNSIDSVHHIHIKEEQKITDYITYFPNATELTLSGDYMYIEENTHSLSVIFNRIVPLVQLAKLNINVEYFYFERMIELLCSAPNIHTLTVDRLLFIKDDFVSLQETETFRPVSTVNRITNLNIRSTYTLEELKLFIHLCPRLECLKIQTPENGLEETVRYLLSKDNINTQHLYALRMESGFPKIIEEVRRLIESERLVDDYLMKIISAWFSYVYVWW